MSDEKNGWLLWKSYENLCQPSFGQNLKLLPVNERQNSGGSLQRYAIVCSAPWKIDDSPPRKKAEKSKGRGAKKIQPKMKENCKKQ